MILTSEDGAKSCCLPGGMSRCRVESIVSIDERGQNGAPKRPQGKGEDTGRR